MLVLGSFSTEQKRGANDPGRLSTLTVATAVHSSVFHTEKQKGCERCAKIKWPSTSFPTKWDSLDYHLCHREHVSCQQNMVKHGKNNGSSVVSVCIGPLPLTQSSVSSLTIFMIDYPVYLRAVYFACIESCLELLETCTKPQPGRV